MWHILLIALFALSFTSSQASPLISDGDRIVFLGDSITQQRLYTTFLEAYLTGRFPDHDLSFVNAGWGGDTAEGANRRLQRDVLVHRPTLVFVNFGMNDGKYQSLSTSRLAWYLENQERLITRIKNEGIRLVMLSPNTVDFRYPLHRIKLPEYPPTLQTMTAALVDLSARHDVTAIDLFHPMTDALRRIKWLGMDRTVIPDGVHPDPSGHLVMAYAVLSALKVPQQIANITLDAISGSVTAEGTQVSDLRIEKAISFTGQDSGLPMFVPDSAQVGLKLVPVQRRLNRHVLTITKLPPGEYDLLIDGNPVARLDATELAAGVNLSNLETPMWKQAERLWTLIIEKNDTYFRRWRDVQLFAPPDWLKGEELELRRVQALAELDAKLTELEGRIKLEKQPVAHVFELKEVQ